MWNLFKATFTGRRFLPTSPPTAAVGESSSPGGEVTDNLICVCLSILSVAFFVSIRCNGVNSLVQLSISWGDCSDLSATLRCWSSPLPPEEAECMGQSGYAQVQAIFWLNSVFMSPVSTFHRSLVTTASLLHRRLQPREVGSRDWPWRRWQNTRYRNWGVLYVVHENEQPPELFICSSDSWLL